MIGNINSFYNRKPKGTKDVLSTIIWEIGVVATCEDGENDNMLPNFPQSLPPLYTPGFWSDLSESSFDDNIFNSSTFYILHLTSQPVKRLTSYQLPVGYKIIFLMVTVDFISCFTSNYLHLIISF
jgi:hypothetical protein